MKEFHVKSATEGELVEAPIPTPGPDQVLIKVVVSGSNPKDWKYPEFLTKAYNSGDDIAGTIHAVGEGVLQFKPGDRVAAFHEMGAPHGSYAEYAVAWQSSTFHLPEAVSFEEAATIPLAAMTSALGLFSSTKLGLPDPWSPAAEPIPLIVYGGASAVGAFAIQLASLANIHPIISIAGRGIPFVESLIDKSKGDSVIDYRSGDEAIRSGVKDVLSKAGLTEVKYAFDGISEKGSTENILAVLSTSGGRLTSVLPPEKVSKTVKEGGKLEVPSGITSTLTYVGSVHTDANDKVFGDVYFRYIARMLHEKRFKGHPAEVVPGGLKGVPKGLSRLKDGTVSGVKYVYRIADTEGLSKA